MARKADKSKNDAKVDHASEASFPASDAPGHSSATGTEAPCRPQDRHAPRVTREEIDQAQRGNVWSRRIRGIDE